MYNILPLPLRRSFIDIIAEAFGHWQSVAGLLGGKKVGHFLMSSTTRKGMRSRHVRKGTLTNLKKINRA
jgi:hypothetical protein